MWWNKWFKSRPKVGTSVDAPPSANRAREAQTLHTQLGRLLDEVDVDALCEDVVLRRFMVSVYWGDIHQLFNAAISARRETPALTAVNLYSYFKVGGVAPSACLQRLCGTLESTQTLSYTVQVDIQELISQLRALSHIHSNPKALP